MIKVVLKEYEANVKINDNGMEMVKCPKVYKFDCNNHSAFIHDWCVEIDDKNGELVFAAPLHNVLCISKEETGDES